MHTLKLLLPKTYLVLDLDPLLLFNLTKLMRLYHNLLLLLIDLRVNNFSGDRLDSPLFDLLLGYVEKLGKFVVLKISLIRR